MRRGPHPLRRRPPLACGRVRVRVRVDLCRFCGLDPWTEAGDSCVEVLVRGRPRVPADFEPQGDLDACRCGALSGRLHHYGCCAEICPWADEHDVIQGEQLIGCGCYCDCGEHPDGPHPYEPEDEPEEET